MRKADCCCPREGVLMFNHYTAVQSLPFDTVRRLAATAVGLAVGDLGPESARGLTRLAIDPADMATLDAAFAEHPRRKP